MSETRRLKGGAARRAAGPLLALLLTACHRAAPDEHDAAPTPSAVAPPKMEHAAVAGLAPALLAADLRVEARRGVLEHSEGLVERHRALLEKHFGGSIPFPLAFQVAASAGGRVAVLLQATRGEARPFLLMLSASGDAVWTRENPLGGVKPGVSEPVVTPGPDGHVCIAWCNGSTSSVAIRRWTEEGAAYSDNEALHFDACDALSVLYWPGRGWVLAVAWNGGATLQRVSENGELAWGHDGMPLHWTWRTAAPVSLALDTPESLLLFRMGQSGGPGSPEYVFASRWGSDGRPMWPGPLSVKRVPGPVKDPSARLMLEPAPDGAIRATLPAAATGAGDVAVEVQSDGTVVRR